MTNNSVQFRQIVNSMAELYERKNKDYGDSFHLIYSKYGMVSSLIRLTDKLNRLESLLNKESECKDESIIDTLMDLANYAIMTIMELTRHE